MKTKIIPTLAALMLMVATAGHAQSGTVPALATDIAPLLVGEAAPDLKVKNMEGTDESLKDILGRKPTVLIFYRGGWCPYCNVHLAELQGIEQDILDMGYQIVGISPDSPENLKASVEKNKLNYSLLSDSDMNAAKAFGLAFQAPEKYREMLAGASGGGNSSGLLPVPAVFVFNTEGQIQFEYINPNYNTRMKGSMLKAVLKSLNE